MTKNWPKFREEQRTRRREEKIREAADPRARKAAIEAAQTDEITIWGIHAVEAALRNPHRRVRRIWATDNAALRLAELIAARKITPAAVSPKDLDQRLGPDTVHQGILIETDPLPEHDLTALAEASVSAGPLLLLDQVTDPHNVGAILRSAAVFGAAGLVMTRRHSPPLGGALAKAASGALEMVPVALVQNLARTLTDLKAMGITIIGLDSAAEELFDEVVLAPTDRAAPLALVLGAEGRGLRQSTADGCTRLCRIASASGLSSLNVSNAAAVSLHVAAMARRRRETPAT